jgi:hypothetical protein
LIISFSGGFFFQGAPPFETISPIRDEIIERLKDHEQLALDKVIHRLNGRRSADSDELGQDSDNKYLCNIS